MSAALPSAAAPAAALRVAGMRAVFERDFLVFTSRPRFLFLRTLAVAAPAALLLAVVTLMHQASVMMGSSRIGSAIYTTFMFVVPGLLLLLAPVVAAPSIASERALHTLDIVLATPVSAYAFVFAKFVSRLCVALVLMAAVLPLAAVCFLYGGVSGSLFFELVAFSVGIAMLGTAAGTVASAWSRSVAAATMSSYFLAIVVPLLHLWTIGAVAASSDKNFFAVGLLIEANPFGTWGMLAVRTFTGTTSAHPGFTFLACMCAVAALAVVAAGYRVRREAAHDVAPRGSRRSASGMRFANPVLDRSLRGSLVSRPKAGSWVMLGLVLFIATAMIVAGALSRDLDEEWPHMVFLIATTFLLALSATARASHTLAAERETGALDMLLATRLTPADVVHGKYVAVLAGIAPLAAVAFLYGLVAAALTDLHLLTVLFWAVGTTVLTTACAALGLWNSCAASTAGRAVMRSFAILIGGTVIHGIAGGILVAATGFVRAEWVWPYVFGASPVAIAIMGPAMGEDRRWGSDEWNAFVAWCLWSIAYGMVALRLVHWTTARLARRRDAA